MKTSNFTYQWISKLRHVMFGAFDRRVPLFLYNNLNYLKFLLKFQAVQQSGHTIHDEFLFGSVMASNYIVSFYTNLNACLVFWNAGNAGTSSQPQNGKIGFATCMMLGCTNNCTPWWNKQCNLWIYYSVEKLPLRKDGKRYEVIWSLFKTHQSYTCICLKKTQKHFYYSTVNIKCLQLNFIGV